MTSQEVQHYDQLLRSFFAGRKIILAPDLSDATKWAQWLVDLGAQRPLVLNLPIRPSDAMKRLADVIEVPIQSQHALQASREYEQVLRDPPPTIRAAIDRYDPAGEACVVVSSLMSLSSIADRPCYGWRRPPWIGLEDKTVIDDFLAQLGIATPDAVQVEANRDSLSAAAASLASPAGTVWSGDSTEGFNGGCEYVRWIRDESSVSQASAFYASHCRRVRVAEFVEGLPCSIHGIVFPDHVSVFRPVELFVLRNPAEGRFLYVGNGTYWDPPLPQRERMRDVSRRVGCGLREAVGYRGAYTVDGIMSRSGFVVTEVNTRFGDAFWTLMKGTPGLPLALVDALVREEHPADYRPEFLERLITTGADEVRAATIWHSIEQSLPDQQVRRSIQDPGSMDATPVEVELCIKTTRRGAMLSVEFPQLDDHQGQPLAGLVSAALHAANQEWALNLGSFTPAANA